MLKTATATPDGVCHICQKGASESCALCARSVCILHSWDVKLEASRDRRTRAIGDQDAVIQLKRAICTNCLLALMRDDMALPAEPGTSGSREVPPIPVEDMEDEA